MADLAVLKTKRAIDPKIPGRIPAILPPRVLDPHPTYLTTDFRFLVSELTFISIVVLTAKTKADTVKPYF